jgi:hypothetical protein
MGGAAGLGFVSSITGTSLMYGSGGAGWGWAGSGTRAGGGGLCCNATTGIATPNRGGGGAPHWLSPTQSGASGVVIIRYPME